MMIRKRKRRGNLLVVVAMIALTFSLVCQIMLRTAAALQQARYDVTVTADTYNVETLGEIAIDEMVADLGGAWRNYVAAVGEKVTWATYEALISDVSQQYFGVSLEDGRKYMPFGDRDVTMQDIAEYIYFDGTTSGAMGSYVKTMAKNVNNLSIVIDHPLMLATFVDDSDEIEHSSGESIQIQDIYATVHLEKGVRNVTQTYVIKNLLANYTVTDAGVNMSIDTSKASVLRVEQVVK